MTAPAYIDGSEVHVGDQVNHGGIAGTVVVVANRMEFLPGYSKEEWQGQGNVLIRQANGLLIMYDDLRNEEDIVLVARGTS